MAKLNLQQKLQSLFGIGQLNIFKLNKNKVVRVDTQKVDLENNNLNTETTKKFNKYKRIRKSSYQQGYDSYVNMKNRIQLYYDYEVMDDDSLISSALDIYADESSMQDINEKVLTVSSDNDKIKRLLETLFYDTLNINFNLSSWARQLCKYGDFFLKLDLNSEYGIYGVQPISPYNMTREEIFTENGVEVKYTLSDMNAYGGTSFESYEIIHFRLLNDHNYLPYGKSVIEPARKSWKMLTMLEDAMLIHRIMRAPEKRVFKIDVGNLKPDEIDSYMEDIINGLKKEPYIDPSTGDYNMNFNVMNMLEDYYLPVRGGQSGTEVESINGLDYDTMDDIEYVKDKVIAGLKIPKSFLSFEDVIDNRSNLVQQDMRFSRTIARIQRTILSELNKIAAIHLMIHGIVDDELLDFQLKLNISSVIYEQEQNELLSERISLANDAIDSKFFSREWVYKNIFHMSDDELQTEQSKVIDDLKLAYRHDEIESSGEDPLDATEEDDDMMNESVKMSYTKQSNTDLIMQLKNIRNTLKNNNYLNDNTIID